MDSFNIEPNLLVRPHPLQDEGPKGYLLRLAEENWIPLRALHELGLIYDYRTLIAQGLLPDERIDPDLHKAVTTTAKLLTTSQRVWNHKHCRFCPVCLADDAYWRVGWELLYYDVCPKHNVWLIDQCSSCGGKVSWDRDTLLRCQCSSDLRLEKASLCPENVTKLAAILQSKLKSVDPLPEPFQKLNIEQTQRLIRYMGAYMQPAAGRNPLKVQQAGAMTVSWSMSSLAAEILFNWPQAFHQSLEKIQSTADDNDMRKLNSVFGRAYHYLYRGLEDAAFNQVRQSFEEWLSASWRGGLAKRNKRLAIILLDRATWIPASLARDSLGISHQRLSMFIREGVIEGETHFGQSGRKFEMVRRDQLELARKAIDGTVDMKTAGALLGLTKSRMRQVLRLLFPEAKKVGGSASSAWSISRSSIEKLVEIAKDSPRVTIPDEDSVAMGHIFRYWAWSTSDVVFLIQSVCHGDIEVTNVLDGAAGISGWIFKESTLKAWKAKSLQGFGSWLTVTQTAKVLNIKEQVAYELVNKDFINGDKLHLQPKGGIRVKRKEVEIFKSKYVFCTELAQNLGVSSRKARTILADSYIHPVSGPGIDDCRQLLFIRNLALEEAMNDFVNKKEDKLRLI